MWHNVLPFIFVAPSSASIAGVCKPYMNHILNIWLVLHRANRWNSGWKNYHWERWAGRGPSEWWGALMGSARGRAHELINVMFNIAWCKQWKSQLLHCSWYQNPNLRPVFWQYGKALMVICSSRVHASRSHKLFGTLLLLLLLNLIPS